MNRFFTICLILILNINYSLGQCNLITNGNFENLSSCPTALSQINRCVGWFDANVVTGSVTYPSTDYFNCSFTNVGMGPAVTPPPSGTGFVGLNVASTYSSSAEMLGTFVNLCAGETYTLSFYSRLAFDMNGGTQPLLIQGTNTASFPVATNANYCPLSATTLLSIPKSDVANANWTLRTYTFTAPANFNALIIGGVCSSSDNYYIYIDNFSLTTNTAASASITALNTVPCGGGNVGIRFNLPTCRGPFNVTYTVNGTPFTLNGISNNHTINLNITTNTTVILTTVTDASGCVSNPNSTLNLVVPPPPSTAASGATASPNPICGGATTLSVVGGSLGAGDTWTWYSGSCGGTLVGTGSSITVSPSTTTTYFVRAEGACGNTSCASVSVTVNTASTAATSINASTNPTCGGATTLSVVGGSLGTGATWNWYSGSCGGTLVGTGNSITVTPSSTTTYFVQAIGACNTTSCTSITINVNSASTAPSSATANPTTVCAGTPVNLTVNGGLLGTGAQWQWFSGSCGGTAVGTGASITVSPSTTTTYFVRAAGTCNTTTCVSVTVNVDLSPTPSNAGSNQSVCGLTATLNANNPSIGTGTWSQISGPGTITFSNPSSNTSSATASTFGTYTLQWNITNGICSSNSTVNITFDQQPTIPNAGNDDAICGLTYTLNGSSPNIGTGTWSTISGPGTLTFSNANSSNSNVTASLAGTYTINWTINNGACSVSDNLTIQFIDLPTIANAGPNDAVCGLTYNLNANTPLVGTGTWTQISGPGTINFSNANSNTSTASASQYGSYNILWTISNATCSTTDTVTINFDELPSIGNLSSTQDICGLNGTLNGVSPNIGTGTWTQTAGSGIITFNNANNPNSIISASASGLYTLTWTVVNGACSVSDNIDVTFFDAPTPVNAGSDNSICGLTTSLNAQIPSVGTGVWTQISGSLNSTISNSNSPSSTFSSTDYGSYTLVWSVTNGACVVSDTTIITFDQNPDQALAINDTTICGNSIQISSNNPSVGIGYWTVINGKATISDTLSNNPQLSNLSIGNNTFVWTISNGSCPSTYDTLNIFVNPSSIIAEFTTDTSIIFAFQVVAFNDLSSGNPSTWHWDFGDGDTSIIQNPGHIYTNTGTYPVTLTITNSDGCIDTVLKYIDVIEKLLIPNVFTPNNDGINDIYKVIASGYTNFNMKIYNRWGALLFESDKINYGWDGRTVSGTNVSDGTYYYVIQLTSPRGEQIIEKGPLQLIR